LFGNEKGIASALFGSSAPPSKIPSALPKMR
jgi:hypothetical protein